MWLDANADGVQNTGEEGIGGVTVRLLDSSGAMVGTTITTADGRYTFAGLAKGNYQVQFVNPNPAWLSFSDARQGSDTALDSDPVPDTPDRLTATTPVFALLQGQPVKDEDAGFKPLAQVNNGAVFFDVKAVQGAPILSVLLAGVEVDLPASLVTPTGQANVFEMKLKSRQGAIATVELKPGVDFTFDIRQLGGYYRWGADAVGNFFEKGKATPSPVPASDAYYWAQYVRADQSESLAGGHNAYYPPKAGNLPTDGKWYLDSPTQVGSPLKNKYVSQEMNENHPVTDGPGLRYGVDTTAAGFSVVTRANVEYLRWTLKESPQQVLDKKIDAAKVKMQGQNFTSDYAQTFQSYLAKKPDAPEGYVTWQWLATLDTDARTMKITIQQPAWHAGTDAAVWDKFGPA